MFTEIQANIKQRWSEACLVLDDPHMSHEEKMRLLRVHKAALEVHITLIQTAALHTLTPIPTLATPAPFPSGPGIPPPPPSGPGVPPPPPGMGPGLANTASPNPLDIAISGISQNQPLLTQKVIATCNQVQSILEDQNLPLEQKIRDLALHKETLECCVASIRAVLEISHRTYTQALGDKNQVEIRDEVAVLDQKAQTLLNIDTLNNELRDLWPAEVQQVLVARETQAKTARDNLSFKSKSILEKAYKAQFSIEALDTEQKHQTTMAGLSAVTLSVRKRDLKLSVIPDLQRALKLLSSTLEDKKTERSRAFETGQALEKTLKESLKNAKKDIEESIDAQAIIRACVLADFSDEPDMLTTLDNGSRDTIMRAAASVRSTILEPVDRILEEQTKYFQTELDVLKGNMKKEAQLPTYQRIIYGLITSAVDNAAAVDVSAEPARGGRLGLAPMSDRSLAIRLTADFYINFTGPTPYTLKEVIKLAKALEVPLGPSMLSEMKQKFTAVLKPPYLTTDLRLGGQPREFIERVLGIADITDPVFTSRIPAAISLRMPAPAVTTATSSSVESPSPSDDSTTINSEVSSTTSTADTAALAAQLEQLRRAVQVELSTAVAERARIVQEAQREADALLFNAQQTASAREERPLTQAEKIARRNRK